MEKLKNRTEHELHPGSLSGYRSLQSLCLELSEKDLPEPTLSKINEVIIDLNQSDLQLKNAKSHIYKARQKIIKTLEKELKIVPKHYYRNLWMILGMSAFGLPLGVAFGAALGNMAFLGIGIPIGLSMGMAIGAGMDEKAKKEGRQLVYQVEI